MQTLIYRKKVHLDVDIDNFLHFFKATAKYFLIIQKFVIASTVMYSMLWMYHRYTKFALL